MMNRRQLLAASAAVAAVTSMPRAFAATYDLVIKGGPIITTLKWIGFAAVAISTVHTARRYRGPSAP